MRRPRVSVVVPCHNLGSFVGEAVDSALAQTLADLEVIVVDDGSTDPQTREVLSSLRRERTTVYRTEQRGLPAARNYGIARGSGEFVCALDADDRLHPTFLERTVGELERDPGLTFVSTWVRCFGTEEWVWRQSSCGFPELLAECVVLTASPVRRAALDAVGGYDERSFLYGCEDWDLWISVVEHGGRGIVLPEVLFDYRQRAGSMRRASESRDVRRRIWDTLLHKHEASYRRYARDVLMLQEVACGRLLRENWDLQFDIEMRTEASRGPGAPVVASACPVDSACEQSNVLERELAAVAAEVRALRASASWRLTAPLRAGYDLWLAARRRAGRGGK